MRFPQPCSPVASLVRLGSIGPMAADDGGERSGRAAGSTNPFDFDDVPTAGAPASPGRRPVTAGDGGFDPFGLATAAAPIGRPRTGQRVSWAALILVVVGALLVGIGIAAGLGSIRLQAASPFGSLLWWGTLSLVGLLIIVAGLVSSIVGVVQAEPRVVAVIALIGAILFGWVAAYIGYRIGAHQVAVEAARVVGRNGPDAVPAIGSYLKERGIDAGPYLGLLRRVLGR